jgi:hypothetical protein
VDTTPTLREINDNAKPTLEQRDALLALHEANVPCRTEAMAIISRNAPADVVGLFQEMQLANVNQLKLLVNGEITFGQFRNNQFQILTRTKQVAAQYLREQSMANAANRQAAAAESQAASAQFSTTMQALQAFNRQPTITTCNRLGGSVNCYSH